MKRYCPLAISMALLLTGCLASAPPVPQDHYYRLMLQTPARKVTEPVFPGVLSVEMLQADGLLRERPLLYSRSGTPHELQQYNYRYWTDAPPRMLQVQIVEYLRRSGLASVVVTPNMRVPADYQISGNAKRFEWLVGDGPTKVTVEIELALTRLSDSRLILVDSFTAEEAATDNAIEDSVVALNRATGRILDRFFERAIQAASKAELADRSR